MRSLIAAFALAMAADAQTCRATNSCAPYVDGGAYSQNYNMPVTNTLRQDITPPQPQAKQNPAYDQQWRDSHYIERVPNRYGGHNLVLRNGEQPPEPVPPDNLRTRALRVAGNSTGCIGGVASGILLRQPALIRGPSLGYCVAASATVTDDIKTLAALPHYYPVEQPKDFNQRRQDAATTSITGRENQWRIQDECHPWTVSVKCPGGKK